MGARHLLAFLEMIGSIRLPKVIAVVRVVRVLR